MTLPCRARAFLAGLALGAAALAPPAARGAGLQRFTGYTNPGTPSDKILPNGAIESAADEPKAFGGSIYFMVLDRGEGRGDDTWGAGIRDFDKSFQTGLDDALKPSPALDRKARYLYLYQVVNDRGSKSPIHQATVRLIIDPALITSWGYFSTVKKDKDKAPVGTGVGFAQPAGADAKPAVVPVSTEHPVGPVKRPFVEDAPRQSAPKPYEMSQIKVGNAPKAIADDPEGEDTGRNPVTVVLLRNADFEGAPEIHTQGRLITYDINEAHDLAGDGQPVAPVQPVAYVDYTTFAPFGPELNPFALPYGLPTSFPGLRPVIFASPDAQGRPDSRHSPAIRAVFYDVEGDIPVRQNERSVLFGFTSNFPPSFEATRLRGSAFVKEAPVDTAAPVGPAALNVDASEVPTPVAFEQATAPVTGIGTVPGTLGGGEAVGAPGAAPGIGAGGFPGFGGLTGGVTGTGGGIGGGTGGGAGNGNSLGNSNAQQAQQQAQNNTPNTTTPISIVNNNNNNNSAVAQQTQTQQQQQSQQQQQQQQQQQEQEQTTTPPGNVVPEPASFASALLGVPFLLLFLRRRKPAAV